MSRTNQRLASRNSQLVIIDAGEVLNVPTGLIFKDGTPAIPSIVKIFSSCPFLDVLQSNPDGSFDVWNPTDNQANFNWTAHHIHSIEEEPIDPVNTVATPSTVPPPAQLCTLSGYATDLELAAEEAARIAADAALQANIDAEEAARIAADAALQAQINQSVAAIYGEMYQFDNANPTTINNTNQWEKVFNFIAGHLDFVTFNNSALVLPNDGDYKVIYSISCAGASNNKNWEFAIGLDGTPQNNTKQKRFISTLDTGAIAGHGIIEGLQGQLVDLRVRNITDSTNITIVNAQITAQFIH